MALRVRIPALVDGIREAQPPIAADETPSRRVDGAGVLVGALVGGHPLAQEFHRRQQAVEVGVGEDVIHFADLLHEAGMDELRAGRRALLVHEEEAGIVPVALPRGVGMVVDPSRQPQAERLDEGAGRLLEAVLGREGEVEGDDPPERWRRGEPLGGFHVDDPQSRSPGRGRR